MASVLGNIPCVLEKNVWSAVGGWSAPYTPVKSIVMMFSIFLLLFWPVVSFMIESGVLKLPAIAVGLSLSAFVSTGFASSSWDSAFRCMCIYNCYILWWIDAFITKNALLVSSDNFHLKIYSYSYSSFFFFWLLIVGYIFPYPFVSIPFMSLSLKCVSYAAYNWIIWKIHFANLCLLTREFYLLTLNDNTEDRI